MSQLTNVPLENAYETNLSGSISASETSIVVDTAPQFTLPSGQTVDAVIDPENSKRERVIITAMSGSTLTVTRGAADYLGDTTAAVGHSGGATLVITDSWSIFDDIKTAVNSKVDKDTGELEAYADATARDAAITSPANGMQCYLTDTGKFTDYTGGSWVDRESGGTFPNASTTVAGKVEIATEAQVKAGTGTGETGAPLVIAPDNAAISNTTAGAADAGSLVSRDTAGLIGAENLELAADGGLEDSSGAKIKIKAGGGANLGGDGLYITLPDLPLTATEDIDGSTTPKPFFVSQGTSVSDTRIFAENTVTQSSLSVYGINYIGQQFTVNSSDFVTSISKISVYGQKAGTPSGDAVLGVYAVDGSGHPTGGALDTVTVLANTCPTSDYWDFTFSSPLSLTPGTQYAFYVTALTSSAGNCPRIDYSGTLTGGYTDGEYLSSSDAGGSWSVGSSDDLVFRVYGWEEQTAGDVLISHAGIPERKYYDGFINENVAATETANTIVYGFFSDFTGLTIGVPYYLHNTNEGEITSGSTSGVLVGKSMTATTLRLIGGNT